MGFPEKRLFLSGLFYTSKSVIHLAGSLLSATSALFLIEFNAFREIVKHWWASHAMDREPAVAIIRVMALTPGRITAVLLLALRNLDFSQWRNLLLPGIPTSAIQIGNTHRCDIYFPDCGGRPNIKRRYLSILVRSRSCMRFSCWLAGRNIEWGLRGSNSLGFR